MSHSHRFRKFTGVVSSCVLVGILPARSHATAGSLAGDGTAKSPYLVSDYADLAAIGAGAYSNTATYRLAADIDATESKTSHSDSGFSPIVFKGTFHGVGRKIANLAISRLGQKNVGLFESLDSFATVDSLTLENVSVAGSSVVGALAAINNGKIVAVSVSGTVRADSGSHAGGLVGSDEGGTIQRSGFVGAVIATGDNAYAGGLVGIGFSDTIESSHAAGTVTANGDSSTAGGLFGDVDSASSVRTSYATAAVEANGAEAYVGGFAGQDYLAAISESFATGAVTATGADAVVGGFAGLNSGDIDTVYATGTITATGSTADVGGLVGYNSGRIDSSYWNTQSTGLAVGVGTNEKARSGTGLTTAQFKVSTSFVGWDFLDIWNLGTSDSAPQLRAFLSTGGNGSTSIQYAAAASGFRCFWSANNGVLSLSVPDVASFQAEVRAIDGRTLAFATGSRALDLKVSASGAAIVTVRSGTSNQSFVVPSLR
jgi:hypothetical protein